MGGWGNEDRVRVGKLGLALYDRLDGFFGLEISINSKSPGPRGSRGVPPLRPGGGPPPTPR